MNVLGEIKHSRRKVNQQRDEAQEEQSSEELNGSGRVAEARERQHVPEHLEKNHVKEQANVAEQFALGRFQKIPTWWFLRGNEVAVNEICLDDCQNQDGEYHRHKDCAAFKCTLSQDEVAQGGEYEGTDHEVQTEVKEGIE